MADLIIIEEKDKIEKKYLTMTATIDFKTKDGELTPINSLEKGNVDMGGFCFECINLQEKSVSLPFDFDSVSRYTDNQYLVYESGDGFLFNEYTISNDFDDSIKEAGFDIYNITPKLLSETTKIQEFHFDIVPSDESKTAIIEDFKLIDVYFTGEIYGKNYHVSKEILDEFNQNWRDRI